MVVLWEMLLVEGGREGGRWEREINTREFAKCAFACSMSGCGLNGISRCKPKQGNNMPTVRHKLTEIVCRFRLI